MVQKSKGFRSQTRLLLRKKRRERGLRPLGYLLVEYKTGDKVQILIDPTTHKGEPHRRYHGKIGVVLGRRGKAYIVKVMDGGKERKIITLPEHLREVKV
ncbi:MAG: 50S ribosomal protein L21e [Candidatus Bathyarchaeota archaeon]